jgi:hypothetical protein
MVLVIPLAYAILCVCFASLVHMYCGIYRRHIPPEAQHSIRVDG